MHCHYAACCHEHEAQIRLRDDVRDCRLLDRCRDVVLELSDAHLCVSQGVTKRFELLRRIRRWRGGVFDFAGIFGALEVHQEVDALHGVVADALAQ